MEQTLGALMLVLFLSGVLGEYSDLVCIPGVGNFSSKLTTCHYYQCDKHVRGKPQLMECPQGEKYGRKEQQCMEDTGAPEPEYISEKGLGRNIQLGSFYDARRGMFFPESSFWKRQTVLDHEEKYEKNAVSVSVTTDTLAKQKMEHLGITADLTLKFMGGFITLHGSFGYIIDKVNVDNEVNAELNFYTTKMRKVLPKQTTLDYRDQCDNTDVTHVVSSVTYGLGAVFNFQRVYEDHEDRSAIEAGLSASIMIIPGISISGGIDVYFNDTIIELLNSTSLKMFGDFSPSDPDKPLPTTFVEAVTFFQSLPSFLGTAEDNWSGTTIMDVQMTPVQEYCADSGNIVDQISKGLTEQLNSMFDFFDQLEMKNGGLLAREPALLYQPIRQNLNLYKTALQSYRLNIQKILQEVLPNILGDPQLGEEELLQILLDYEQSQFQFDTSEQFLVNRYREIKAVQYLIERFPEETNIAIADYEMANDVEFIFKKEKVVVLEFNILTPKSLTQGFLDGIPVDESNFWFNDIESNARIGSVLRNLSDFALANANQEDRGYLVKLSLIEAEKEEFVMSALIKGQLLSDDFVVPPELTTPSVYDISHERFKFSIPKGNKFVTGCIVYVTDNIPGPNGTLPIVREIVQMFPDDLATDDVEIVAYNLSPGHVYSFNVRYLTEVGSSPPCLDSDPGFFTAPVSPPNTLSADLVSSNRIKLSWTAPDIIAEYLHINKSLISYRIKLKDYEVITDYLEVTLTNLEPGTEYIMEAMAFISEDITNGTQLPDSSPSIISVYTVPLPPQNLMCTPENVGEHSVDLIWDPPAKLIQADTLYYIVEYFSEGGPKQEHVVKDIECKITNLARGTLYSFSVKVVTVGGASELSEELWIETMYVMTEFEKIKAELYDFLGDVASEARAKSNFCAFKATTNQEIITYDSVYLNDNNVNGASMDNSTGYFIAGATGSYQVMVSLEMKLEAGQDHDVWMIVNDETVEESRMSSSNDNLNVSPATDNGSRNIVLVLNAGDKVYLGHQTNGLQTLNSVTFCVSLIKI